MIVFSTLAQLAIGMRRSPSGGAMTMRLTAHWISKCATRGTRYEKEVDTLFTRHGNYGESFDPRKCVIDG